MDGCLIMVSWAIWIGGICHDLRASGVFLPAGCHRRIAEIRPEDTGSIYDALSIFLLLSIGLQGGVKLAGYPLQEVALDSAIILLVAALIPLLAFPALRYLGRMTRADSASIAAHYGSVSVVTFSVGVTFLGHEMQIFEGYMVVFLVLLEIPALVIGVLLARYGGWACPLGEAPARGVSSARASIC
jgi:hypothetical protein